MMSAVSSPAPPTAPAQSPQGAVAPGGDPTLLPWPQNISQADLDDAMSLILKLLNETNAHELKAHKAELAGASGVREARMAELEKKYEEWKASENNPFKWLVDVFKGIALALSAVLSVCTGGALSGLMAGAVALSVASFVVEKTEMFGPEASKIVSMVMGAVSALGNISLAAFAPAKAAMDAATTAVKLASSTVDVGEQIAAGASMARTYEHDQKDIERQKAQQALDQYRAYIEIIIEGIKNLHASQRHAVETVNETIQTKIAASTMVVAGWRV